jgi:hypothetical protein
MKHMLEIGSSKVLLSHTQLEIITEVLGDVELLGNKYVGTSKGMNGTAYVPEITKPLLHEWFKTSPVEENYIDSLKLAQKIQAGQA